MKRQNLKFYTDWNVDLGFGLANFYMSICIKEEKKRKYFLSFSHIL